VDILVFNGHFNFEFSLKEKVQKFNEFSKFEFCVGIDLYLFKFQKAVKFQIYKKSLNFVKHTLKNHFSHKP